MSFNPTAFKTLCALILTVGSAFNAAGQDKPEDKNGDAMSLSRADSTKELQDRILRLFSGSSTAELDRLVCSPDTTVALAAGWERVLRTMPRGKQEEVFRPDSLAISRFIGLVEGRIQVPFPEIWETTVKSGFGHSRACIEFSYNQQLLEKSFAENNPLKRDGDYWIVTKGNKTIKVPLKQLKATAQFDGETVYVAQFGANGNRYRLLALDWGSAKEIWSSTVWAAGFRRGIQGGPGFAHFAAIRLAGDTLVVYGNSIADVYVEVFDKKTGKNRCRFSTAYFDEISPQQ